MESSKLLFFSFSLLIVCVAAGKDHEKGGLSKQSIPKDMCKIVLEKLAQTLGNYTECTSVFARPIQLCQRCRDSYLAVIHAYQYMEDFKQDNISCKVVLTQQDFLGVINDQYSHATGPQSLWSRSHCSNCYENNNFEQQPANHTTKFLSLWNQTIACFNQFMNVTNYTHDYEGYKSLMTKNATNATALCNNCSAIYDELRSFFWREIVPSAPSQELSGVCYDIRDRFNLTGIIWKEESHCEPRPDFVSFLVPIIIINVILIMLVYTCEPFIFPYFFPGYVKEKVNLVQQDTFDGDIYEVDEETEDPQTLGNFQVLPGITGDEYVNRFREYEITKADGTKTKITAPPPPEEHYDLEWNNDEWVPVPRKLQEKCFQLRKRFKKGEIDRRQMELQELKLMKIELTKKKSKRKRSHAGGATASFLQASGSGEDLMRSSLTAGGFNDLMTSSTLSTLLEADVKDQ